MNCVLEVADAESVTGNPYALAVTCPDKVHFIKGMSKEESKKYVFSLNECCSALILILVSITAV